MEIGEVSHKIGIPASTLRYYEKIDLIDRLDRVSGRRQFDTQSLFVLEFIKLAQLAGFSIAEIKQLKQAYKADPSSKGTWKEMAEQKRAQIQEQILSLLKTEAILNEVLSCRCLSLTACIERGIASKQE